MCVPINILEQVLVSYVLQYIYDIHQSSGETYVFYSV